MRGLDLAAFNKRICVRGIVEEIRGFEGGCNLLIEEDGTFLGVLYFGKYPKTKKGMCAAACGELKLEMGSLVLHAREFIPHIC